MAEISLVSKRLGAELVMVPKRTGVTLVMVPKRSGAELVMMPKRSGAELVMMPNLHEFIVIFNHHAGSISKISNISLNALKRKRST